jgi:hypothetical protein
VKIYRKLPPMQYDHHYDWEIDRPYLGCAAVVILAVMGCAGACYAAAGRAGQDANLTLSHYGSALAIVGIVLLVGLVGVGALVWALRGEMRRRL